jgi:hypothetical protein
VHRERVGQGERTERERVGQGERTEREGVCVQGSMLSLSRGFSGVKLIHSVDDGANPVLSGVAVLESVETRNRDEGVQGGKGGSLELDRIFGGGGEHDEVAIFEDRELGMVRGAGMMEMLEGGLHMDPLQRPQGDRVEGRQGVLGDEEVEHLAVHGEVEALPGLKEGLQEVFASQLPLQWALTSRTHQCPSTPRAAGKAAGDPNIEDRLGEGSVGDPIVGHFPAQRSQ